MSYIKKFFGINNLIFEMTVARLVLLAAVFILSAYYSGPAERVAILLFGCAQIVSMFSDLGINNGFNRDLAKKIRYEDGSIYRDALIKCRGVYWLLSVPVFSIMLFYTSLVLKEWTDYYWVTAVYAIILYLSKPLDIQLKCESKYMTLNKIDLFASLATSLMLGLLVFVKESLLFIDYACLSIICSGVVIFVKRLQVPRFSSVIRVRESWLYFRDILSLAGPLGFVSFSIQLVPSLTLPLIASSLESSAAAGMVIIYRSLNIIDQISWGSFYGHLPRWYRVRDSDELTFRDMRYRARVVVIKFAILGCVLLLIVQLEIFKELLKVELDMVIILSLFLWFIFARIYGMHTQILLVCSKLQVNWFLFLVPLLFGFGVLGIFNFSYIFVVATLLVIGILFSENNNYEKISK